MIMKKILSKNPALIVMSWFAAITIIAALLSSCGVHYVQCDAYGSNNEKQHLDLKSKYKFKITKDAKEEFLANNK